MSLAAFDAVGILIYLLIAIFIYKKAWFYSFYSFIKFLLVLAISLALGLTLAAKNPYNLPLTNLQLSLLIQGLSFAVFWKTLSLEKLFFPLTGRLNINRFIFFHHIDRVLNVVPALVASFFVTFFMFTVLVSASTGTPALAGAIEASKIIRPLSYQIYFASTALAKTKLFEGIAFRIIPAVEFHLPALPATRNPQINNPGGAQNFIPPQVSTPTTAPGEPLFIPPSATPVPIEPTRSFFQIPAPTSVSRPTDAPFIPQPTFVMQPTNPPPTPTPIPVFQPNPITQKQQINTSQAEQDIFRMTNEERAKNGLPALAWSDALAAVARAHSQDMVTRNFFSHINPDGLDPFDRMRRAGITYNAAGENIAGAATADIIMVNWMNSPGHRANILKTSFGKLGVGVASDPKYGLVATQNFTN